MKANCSMWYGEETCGNFKRRASGFLAAGKVMPRHVHNFDHVTIVFSGSIRVCADGGAPEIVTAPGWYLVKAGVAHEITALEDGTGYWCVYSHRDAQGEVVQEPDNQAAYF